MKRTFLFLLLAIGGTIFYHGARGSEVRLVQIPRGAQEVARVDVLLDTQGKTLNGVQGSFSYDPREMSVHSIDDSNSIVPIWIERPRKGDEGKERVSISFSGIMPGGYEGSNGKLFTLFLMQGDANNDIVQPAVLRMESGLGFLHDGAGSSIAYGSSSLSLLLRNVSSGVALYKDDLTPPEPFEPLLIHDPALFDDAFIVIFSAVDKGSGIARYEVAETPVGADQFLWKEATSPYELNDQHLASDVYVRAVDNAGNVRIVKAVSREREATHQIPFIIIICIGSLVLWCVWWLFRKK